MTWERQKGRFCSFLSWLFFYTKRVMEMYLFRRRRQHTIAFYLIVFLTFRISQRSFFTIAEIENVSLDGLDGDTY